MNIDNVRLRDIVTTFPPASGMLSGRVVGIDTQGPAVIVRWDSGAMDVYSENSPVWASCTVERDPPCEQLTAPAEERRIASSRAIEQAAAAIKLPWSE